MCPAESMVSSTDSQASSGYHRDKREVPTGLEKRGLLQQTPTLSCAARVAIVLRSFGFIVRCSAITSASLKMSFA